MTTVAINFSEFTSDNSMKYDLDLPFVIGKYEYATDSRIILRRPTTAFETTCERLPVEFIEWIGVQ